MFFYSLLYSYCFLMFKHWFCWKYQCNKYMFNFIDHLHFNSCEWSCTSSLHWREGYVVKTALQERISNDTGANFPQNHHELESATNKQLPTRWKDSELPSRNRLCWIIFAVLKYARMQSFRETTYADTLEQEEELLSNFTLRHKLK